MEPFSIHELTVTVLKASWKVFEFCKAIHDAPSDIQEYVEVLKSTREILVNVEEYAAAHKKSNFESDDGTQLRALTTVLKECELSFTLQLSTLESYQGDNITSRFRRMRKRGEYLFRKEAIHQSMEKLRTLQSLLAQTVSTSAAKNSLIIRDQVARLETEIGGVREILNELQSGVSMLLHIAQRTGVLSRETKRLMLFSLNDLVLDYNILFDELQARCHVFHATTARQALSILQNESISAVLICEPKIMRSTFRNEQARTLANTLVTFTHNGGTTLFACDCSSYVRPRNLDNFFQDLWGLPWQSGEYFRTTFSLNPGGRFKYIEDVAPSYSMKAVHLKNVQDENLIYRDSGDLEMGSVGLGSEPDVLIDEGPVVLSPYGNGKLGWIGDVNNEEATQRLIIRVLSI